MFHVAIYLHFSKDLTDRSAETTCQIPAVNHNPGWLFTPAVDCNAAIIHVLQAVGSK